jgi:hypothetical protein
MAISLADKDNRRDFIGKQIVGIVATLMQSV